MTDKEKADYILDWWNRKHTEYESYSVTVEDRGGAFGLMHCQLVDGKRYDVPIMIGTSDEVPALDRAYELVKARILWGDS